MKLTLKDGTVLEGNVSEIKGLGVLRTSNERGGKTLQQLYERSLKLPTSVKIRKTFVVSEGISGAIDELSQISGLEKSQLLEMAIADFIGDIRV